MGGAMLPGLSAHAVLILPALLWKAAGASTDPVTFTTYLKPGPSHLSVKDTVRQKNAGNCLNWCTRKYKTQCRLVFFDPESKECQRVLGNILPSEPEVGPKQLLVRYRQRKELTCTY